MLPDMFLTGAGDQEDVTQGTPSRPKLPPVPAHLRRLLKPPGTKNGAHTSQQDMPAGSVKIGPEPGPTSCMAPCQTQQPAAELHAAILQQAAKLKPIAPAQAPTQVSFELRATTTVFRRAA